MRIQYCIDKEMKRRLQPETDSAGGAAIRTEHAPRAFCTILSAHTQSNCGGSGRARQGDLFAPRTRPTENNTPTAPARAHQLTIN
jgi:hypothetical protein